LLLSYKKEGLFFFEKKNQKTFILSGFRNMMPRQFALPFARAQDFSEAGFLQAPCNEVSWAWLAQTPDWPQARMAIWGPEGSGKSHLLQIWARRQGGSLLRGPALRFTGPEPAAAAVDDADLAPEHDLLHLLNAMAELHRPVLLASRSAPARWPVALPDLASRLRAMLAVEILPADDELLGAMFARLLRERQIRVGEEMQAWLRLRLPRTQAAMHAAAALLDRLTLRIGSGVTWPVAREVVAALQDPPAAARRDDDFADASPAPPALF
jgi:chromosomal replication initiation ATPase DnaA